MACSNCKKKSNIMTDLTNSKYLGNGMTWFVIIWSLLAIYGLYSLIIKIL